MSAAGAHRGFALFLLLPPPLPLLLLAGPAVEGRAGRRRATLAEGAMIHKGLVPPRITRITHTTGGRGGVCAQGNATGNTAYPANAAIARLRAEGWKMLRGGGATPPPVPAPAAAPSGWLRHHVIGGHNNQRQCYIHALLIARDLGLGYVLPRTLPTAFHFNTCGATVRQYLPPYNRSEWAAFPPANFSWTESGLRRWDGAHFSWTESGLRRWDGAHFSWTESGLRRWDGAHFGALWDAVHFAAAAAAIGVRVARDPPAAAREVQLPLPRQDGMDAERAALFNDAVAAWRRHIRRHRRATPQPPTVFDVPRHSLCWPLMPVATPYG
eukprot:gene29389-11711_t